LIAGPAGKYDAASVTNLAPEHIRTYPWGSFIGAAWPIVNIANPGGLLESTGILTSNRVGGFSDIYIAGAIIAGSTGQFTVDASGNINTSGTITVNGSPVATGTGTNALSLPLTGAQSANQSNAWVNLSGLTNIAQVNFMAPIYTNLYLSGCSNMMPGHSFTIWITQASATPTNLVTFNTNFWQPQIFGQILSMPGASTSSGQLLSCFAIATNVVKFTQTLFP
jgi:hypothetical protein